jgi:hypothetical protein
MVYFIIVPYSENTQLYLDNLSKILTSNQEYHIFYLKKNNFLYNDNLFNNHNFLNVVNKIVDFYNYDKIIFHSTKYVLNENLESNHDVTYTFNCKDDILINLDVFLQNDQIIKIKENTIDYLYDYSFLVIIKTNSLKLVSFNYKFNSVEMMMFYIIKYLNKIGCSFNYIPLPIYRISNLKTNTSNEGNIIKTLESNYLNNIINYNIIYFSLIGKKGRLGNQLFQYAFLYKIHKLTKREIYFPTNINSIPEYSLNHFPKIKYFTIKENILFQTLPEKEFSYDTTLLNNISKNTHKILNITGFYQSPFYFNDIRNDILDIFTFPKDIFDKAKNWYKQLEDNIIISMHIRRGDYIKFKDYHFILPDTYYNNCINYLEKKITNFSILIFSDDIQWCKDNFKFKHKVIFSENNGFITDLILMSLCDHNIIANSSFGWWGAYLNKKDNLILCPNKWFGKLGPKKHDLYLDNWIVIDIN